MRKVPAARNWPRSIAPPLLRRLVVRFEDAVKAAGLGPMVDGGVLVQ